MPITLTSFPKLSTFLVKQSGYVPVQYSFSYDEEKTQKILNAEPVSESFPSGCTSVLRVSDPDGIWDAGNNNLIITGQCAISAPACFFGEHGILPKSGTLGIAIEWIDNDSLLRGTCPIAEYSFQDRKPESFPIHLEFRKQSLRGSLKLCMVCYLKSPGTPEKDEAHLASTPGTILGILDETKILLEGNGSVFPIIMTEQKDRPLWWVECNWGDPLAEPFISDNFCLYINKSHRHAKYLGNKKEMQETPLFLEIAASALQILITSVLNDRSCREETIRNLDIVPGSVSYIVHYLIDKYDLETDTAKPEVLAAQLRSMLEKRMGK